jgi:hypothetical protein
MKTAFLCGIALVCSSAAFAQTPAAPGSTMRPTVTLTGCVAGGVNQPITLANAMVVPAAAEASTAATTPSPVPGAVSSSPTQLPITAGESGAAGTSSTAAAGTAGTAGTSVTAGTPEPVGTTGTVTGTAPAGSSASSASGYRLSGNDMTSWVGRREQIVGLIVPPAGGASAAPGSAAPRSSTPTPTMPELRVVSVQPTTGDCPQK